MKETHDKFNQEFVKLISDLAAKYGMVLDKASAKTDNYELTYSLAFKSTDLSVLREEFEIQAEQIGLWSGLFGQSFEREGIHYTIFKIKTSARKYKVLARRDDGGISGFTVDGINAMAISGRIGAAHNE